MLDESFELPVSFQNQELSFPAKLVQTGYTHRFEVSVYDTSFYFEPDEERNYRALIEGGVLPNGIPPELLRAIAEAIEKVLR